MLERICAGLLILLALAILAGVFMTLADWIMARVIRVFPVVEDWLKTLPLYR